MSREGIDMPMTAITERHGDFPYASDDNDAAQTTSTKGRRRAQQTQQLICSECGHGFHLLSELNKHMWHEHGSNSCCSKSHHHHHHHSHSCSIDDLTAAATAKYKCSMCDREFVALSSKSRHEREHAGLKPFPCQICAFEFTRMSNLRTHLLRTHAKDVGVLYRLYKSDNAIKFEFDLEAIRLRKEQQKLGVLNSSAVSLSSSDNLRSGSQQAPNNVIIYIRDPKNKSGDIQHMVVYINGKPIFVQDPNLRYEDTKLDAPSLSPKRIKIPCVETHQPSTSFSTLVDEIKRKQQSLPPPPPPPPSPKRRADDDTRDYMQLVSMFRQKNQKLFNPLNS